jgi:pimeloyl-ACP methyl ester carboxylesterase
LNTTVRIPVSGPLHLAADIYQGSGRGTVILAHGGGQTRHSWSKTGVALAARGWTAISLDLRGHGDSDWAEDGDYQMRRFGEDVLAVALAQAGKPHLIGASLGGMAGLMIESVIAPGTFASLTLVDIVPNTNPDGVDKIMGFMGQNAEHGFTTLEEAADSIAAYLPHRQRPKDLTGLAKNLRQGPDGRYRWHWDPRFMSIRQRTDPAAPQGGMPDHTGMALPVHLVRGRMSELVSLEAAQAFIASLKNGAFTDVADAHHMVAGDRNDIFLEAVTAFLDRVV